ncbi:hypothetical protein AC249_AIPGENE27170 [Exaiptasia diaphana]|nr:hypothetical protein AC249_AIPGENE27170 [Exaiptasia diaphana]
MQRRRNLTTESANVVYYSLIRPILEYCTLPHSLLVRRRKTATEVVKEEPGGTYNHKQENLSKLVDANLRAENFGVGVGVTVRQS